MLDRNKSMDNLDNSAKRTNKTLERTQELMKGTRGGSRAANAAFQQTEYNTARGTVGTGAGGRDFAKQSRELDGLVRLYAVYAANIFAAGAAFRALSDAMDTTNMIAGLNQLGAASGVAMGGLAKQFSEASGGAISLRESMEATAKAVSSGLSQTQFLKLGEVAKKASQALGVNMSDAVSRLTRGITKLEPELLDELGIFTKVGQATEDYARKIGKPASALTDFEKRQAFANAVLAEGAKKFGDIDIPTNPYDKLLATLKNVAQAGLEIVNNVLGPFAKLLANNSGLLVGALTLIGIKLVKDALPAIGQWRAGLKDAADDARKRSSEIAASFGEKFLERTNAAFKVPDLQRDLKEAESQYKASRAKFASIDNDYAKQRKGSQFYENLTKGTTSPGAIQREINTLKEAGLSIDSKVIKNLEEQKRQLEAVRSLRKQLNAAENAALDKAEGSTGGIGDTLRRRAARNARAGSERLDILSNVSTNAQEQGFLPTIRAMNKELADSKTLNGLDKWRVRVSGTFIAAANSVGLFVSAFSNIAGPAMVVFGIFTSLLPLLRKNEEEAARFSASLDQLKESSENAYRVLERLAKLDPLERITIENISARANALAGIGDALTKSFDDFEKELANRNWADSTLNFLAGIIGRSSEDLLAKQVVGSIERAVALAGSSEKAIKLRADLAALVSLPADASGKAIAEGLKYAGPVIKKEAAKLIDSAGKEAVRSSGSFKLFNESLVESGKLYQDLQNTFKSSSPLAKFAEDSSKKILELTKVLETGDITERLTELTRLSNDQNFLQLFPIEAAKNILNTTQSLQKMSTEYANLDSLIDASTTAISDWEEIASKVGYNPLSFTGKPEELAKAEQAIDNLKKLRDSYVAQKDATTQGLDGAAKTFASSMRDGLVANIKTFTEGLRDAAARAGLEIKKTASEGIVDARLKARVESGIEMKTLDLDKALLTTQKGLIDSNAQLKLAIMENTYAINIGKPGVVKPGESEDQALARPENKALLLQKNALSTLRDNLNSSVKDINAKFEDQKKNRTGPDSGTIEGLGQALGTAQARAELESKFAQLAGKQQSAGIRKQFGAIEADKTERLKSVQEAEKDIEAQRQALDQKRGTMTDDEYQAAKAALDISKAEYAYTAKLVEANATVLKAKAAATGLSKEEGDSNIAAANKILDTTRRQAQVELDLVESSATIATNTATALAAFDAIEKAKVAAAKTTTDDLTAQIELNTAAQSRLGILRDQGMINDDAFKKESDRLTILGLQLDKTKQITDAEETRRAGLSALDRKEKEAGGPLSAAAKALQQVDRDKINKDADTQVAGIKRVMDARIADAKMIQEQTLRQDAYTNAFNQAFKGMEDAIVSFTKTGKLSFSDMINSFGEALLRFEIQASQRALFEGLGGAGGMGKSLAGAASSGIDWFTGLFKSAQGSVYDGGLTKFAQGGMFTNSVVSSPTLFKFAQGTGMMGEAGPEAIMPLKRDSNGNLGVRTNQQQQGNVDVVVNNYGNEKATTRETTDSQGNRKIEVMIGEMVSKEVSRTGSSTQQAFSTTFGSRPALARR